MSKMLTVLVALFAAAWFAVPAFATYDPNAHYIEICKHATGSPALTGTFHFTVTNGTPAAVDVEVGHCSGPIAITGDKAKIVETGNAWYEINSVTYLDGNGVTHSLAAGKAEDVTLAKWDGEWTIDKVPVLGTGIAHETVIDVTNDPVTGTLEICKYAEDTSGASGTFAFGITSPQDGWATNLPAIPDASVTIGVDRACGRPITVPAGTSIVTERGAHGYLYVTDIDVTPSHHLAVVPTTVLSPNPDVVHGSVAVTVPSTAAADGETMVAFTNSMATLKVCKKADSLHFDEEVAALGPYSFSSTGAAAKFSLNPVAPDYAVMCHEVGRFAAGAQVTVTEDAAPGTFVQSIQLNRGAFDEEHGDVVDLAKRTVTFYVRPGMNEVQFTNMLARSDPLKVCKLGTGVTGTFSFTVTGATGFSKPFWGIPADSKYAIPANFTVLAGQCTAVGYFPFNSTITIAETSGTLLDVAIDPTSTSAVLVSKNLAARSGVILLGNYEKAWMDAHDFFPAIVNFTNGPGSAVVPATTTPPVTSATTPPVTLTTVAVAPPTQVVTPAKATVMKVASARIVTVGKARFVLVRVNGAAKTARIHVTLINKQHKVVGKLTRYVATNKAVRVGNLRLTPTILSVKVSL